MKRKPAKKPTKKEKDANFALWGDSAALERLSCESGSRSAKAPKAPSNQSLGPKSEHDLQVACVKWFALQYPEKKRALRAVPNGGSRNVVTGQRLKMEGVLAGVSDLQLLLPGGKVAHIEMKVPKGRVSENQKKELEFLARIKHSYHVVRTLEEFQAIVNNYMKKYNY